MSYQQQPRIMPPPAQRLSELLEAIKAEFDTVTTEASVFRMHKDDFDVKCKYFLFEMPDLSNIFLFLQLASKRPKCIK